MPDPHATGTSAAARARVRERNQDGRYGYQIGHVWIFYEDGPLDSMCEVWQGAVGVRGYPVHGDGQGGYNRAYRTQWERKHGAIPPGYQIHHLCARTNCVNVAHMELLTDLEHAARHRTFDYEEAASLYKQGWTMREIAGAVGAPSHYAVRAALARMRKRGEL